MWLVAIVLDITVIDETAYKRQFHQLLLVPILYKSVKSNFSLVTVRLSNFLRKNIDTKAAHKMLMKLTTSVNFINVLLEPFHIKVFYAAFL